VHRLGYKRPTHRLVLNIKIIVEPDGDGFYAYAPAFEGLHVFGDTEDEVLKNAREAVKLNILSLAKHGEPLPVGPDFKVEHERLPEVPDGAFLRDVNVSWGTSRLMSGAN
jgi:predicted RNase H-like HicB family nuclease